MNKATGFICKYILVQLYSFAFGFLKRIHVDIHLQITNTAKLRLNTTQGNFHMYADFRKNSKGSLLLPMSQVPHVTLGNRRLHYF